MNNLELDQLYEKKAANNQNIEENNDQSVDADADANETVVQFHKTTAIESTDEKTEDEKENRGQWTSQLDFLFSVIGFAVDLSNVFRFPYICYQNGGGAYLIPYFVMLIVIAVPAFYLELFFGQYIQCGGLTIWKICPILKGVGYASILMNVYVALYYNVIIAWACHYLYHSFSKHLPWINCNNTWNTPDCVEFSPGLNNSHLNNTQLYLDTNENKTDPSTEYLIHEFLRVSESEGIGDMGPVRTPLILSLLVVYIIIFFCLFKGVRILGKAVWITAILPYFILLVLLIRGLFLEGSLDGILYFIRPDFNNLLRPSVWMEAATQICFSIGVGFSVHIAYASYNDFHQKIHRDCLVAAVVNSFTSLFSGFVVFTYLGYISSNMGKNITSVVNQNPALIFVVYPKALATLPLPQLWSVIFFLMLICLGLDSSFGALEAFITAVVDEFAVVLKKIKHRRALVTGILMIFLFLLSIPNTTYGGFYLIQLLDKYCASFSLLTVSLFQCIGFVWMFGIDNIQMALKEMNNLRFPLLLRIVFKFVLPLGLLSICLSSFFISDEFSVELGNKKYVYPGWSKAIGTIITLSSIILIPITAIFVLFRKKGRNWKEKIALAISPTSEYQIIKEKKIIKRFQCAHWKAL